MEENLTTKIRDYIQSRGVDKLEKLDKEITKLAVSANDADQQKLEQKQQELVETKAKFEPRNWLTDAAKRAKQIQFVTHAVKFIHSDAKGSNVNYVEQGENKLGIISTSSVKQAKFDVCGNAAALDVAGLLMKVTHNERSLAEAVLADDISPFLPIAENEQQAQTWLTGFKAVFAAKDLSSHKLAKQVYWPINNSTTSDYHLLSPLFASSLAQEVFDTRKQHRDIYFSKDEQLKANGVRVMPQLAVQTYGGTKPQNISQLNSQRGGKNYLLDNRPPEWQEQVKPPLNTDSVFMSAFPRLAYNKAKAAHRLKYYLEKVADKPSTFDIKECRRKGVDDIVDILIIFAASVQSLPAGWSQSSECKLSLDEQLWLDPGRAAFDQDFQQAMDRKIWHNQVAHKFASWLNQTLQSSKLNLGDVEHAQWKVHVAQELRLTERARKEFY